MISSCFLVTPIAPSYMRNNRSTKQKSLRCFPTCKPAGHVNGGFCGQSLRSRMLIENAYEDRPMNISDYVFVAEIRPSDKPNISALLTVNKSELMSKVRTRQEKEIGVREIFLGEVEVLSSKDDELDLEITFNSRHQSWDYSWRSNRWTSDKHVVDLIVLTYSNPTEYKVVSHFTTCEFFLLSSHKRVAASNEEVIHDKVRVKKSHSSDQMAKKRQKGPSSATMFTENFDMISGQRRAAPQQGSDSEVIAASHALSLMSESAIHHAFEDFDGGDLPLPIFVPGTNTLVMKYDYTSAMLANEAVDAALSSWNSTAVKEEQEDGGSSSSSSSMIMLPPRQHPPRLLLTLAGDNDS